MLYNCVYHTHKGTHTHTLYSGCAHAHEYMYVWLRACVRACVRVCVCELTEGRHMATEKRQVLPQINSHYAVVNLK